MEEKTRKEVEAKQKQKEEDKTMGSFNELGLRMQFIKRTFLAFKSKSGV
jgi:hypothetical protein